MREASVQPLDHIAAHTTSGQDPTVVFVSAMGQGAEDWTPVIARLTSGPRALTYDRPGIGLTPPRPYPNPALPYSSFAAELGGLLDAHDLHQPVVLVGHSFGDLVAQTWAAACPERVAGAVHVDGSLPGLDLGGKALRVDGEGPDATVIDVAEADQIPDLIVPPCPAVVLSRTPGWWWPPGTSAPAGEDERWHTWQEKLACRWSAPRWVARDAGHQLPTEAPALVALAVDLVVRAVRDGRNTAGYTDAISLETAGGHIASVGNSPARLHHPPAAG